MSRSATSSEPRARTRTAVVFLATLLLWPGAAAAKVLVTVEEALALAFPGCAIERRTVYLTAAQLERARALAGVEISSAVLHPYAAMCDSVAAGIAYFDTHIVRTLPETILVAIDPDGRVLRVEVVAFAEPETYLARGKWYEQFPGRGLDPELALKRGIRGLTGATLTARAATQAVRRVLALHAVTTAQGGSR